LVVELVHPQLVGRLQGIREQLCGSLTVQGRPPVGEHGAVGALGQGKVRAAASKRDRDAASIPR
jgi:hypothetical protein